MAPGCQAQPHCVAGGPRALAFADRYHAAPGAGGDRAGGIRLCGDVAERQDAGGAGAAREPEGVRECARRIREPCRFPGARSEEHTSELQSLMRISYAVFCLKKKKTTKD